MGWRASQSGGSGSSHCCTSATSTTPHSVAAGLLVLAGPGQPVLQSTVVPQPHRAVPAGSGPGWDGAPCWTPSGPTPRPAPAWPFSSTAGPCSRHWHWPARADRDGEHPVCVGQARHPGQPAAVPHLDPAVRPAARQQPRPAVQRPQTEIILPVCPPSRPTLTPPSHTSTLPSLRPR